MHFRGPRETDRAKKRCHFSLHTSSSISHVCNLNQIRLSRRATVGVIHKLDNKSDAKSMTHTPPVGSRPKLPSILTQSTESPRYTSQSATPVFNAFAAPAGAATYSPFRSAGLIPPSPYGGPMQFSPRPFNSYWRYTRFRTGGVLWLLLVLGGLMLWWFNGGRVEVDIVRLGATELGQGFFPEARMQGLQFFPATNPKIHVWWSFCLKTRGIADYAST